MKYFIAYIIWLATILLSLEVANYIGEGKMISLSGRLMLVSVIGSFVAMGINAGLMRLLVRRHR